MRAVVYDSYGPPEVLRLDDVERPIPKEDEVLIRIHATTVNRTDTGLRSAEYFISRFVTGLLRPKNKILGMEFAGEVEEVGAGVTEFKVGDEVFGIGRGSFAEYARAREDKLVPKPANVTFEQAAVVAVSGLTALQSLRDAGRVKQGQHVLIIGASGGVGTFAVQIAKSFGAEVTGVCSTAKADLVSSIGADHVIDYTQSDLTDGPQRYDLILDIGGNTPLSRLRRVLTPRGTLVIVGGEESGRWTGLSRQLRALALSPFVRQRLTIRVPKETHVDIGRLAELIESGQLSPVIDRSYPLADAADAMRHLEAGHARGKIAIAVRADADPPGA